MIHIPIVEYDIEPKIDGGTMRRLRLEAGLTIQQMANECFWSFKKQQNLESHGLHKVTKAELELLNKALNQEPNMPLRNCRR